MNDRIQGVKWIAFTLLMLGMILKWIHIDEQAIFFNVGFIVFSIISFVDAIKAKYYQQRSLELLRVILPLVILLAAIGNIVYDNHNYTVMLLAVLLLSALAQRKALLSRFRS